jgi:autotransporter family porin
MSYGSKTAKRRFVQVVAPLVFVIAGPAALFQSAPATAARGVTLPAAAAGPAGLATKTAYFHTLPPGARLPSDAHCARLVNASPQAENKHANKQFNQRKGRHVSARFLADDGSRAQKLARRIDGNFTGTTIDILRWAACKWGIDQDIVFAQAAVESWWHQDTLGDFGTDGSKCLAGHKIGQDGKPGQCPQSYGILQNRYPYEPGGWPAIASSTAMNADAAYAIWRSCFKGYETWLNTVQRGSQYRKGDTWGCVGRWFAGRWRTRPALRYVAKVKKYLREKIWLTPNFQQ